MYRYRERLFEGLTTPKKTAQAARAASGTVRGTSILSCGPSVAPAGLHMALCLRKSTFPRTLARSTGNSPDHYSSDMSSI